MLKILQINNYHYPRGGADRYFLEVTRLLKDEGHNVRTVSPQHNENIQKNLLLESPPKGVDTETATNLKSIIRFLYSHEMRTYMKKTIESFRPDIAHLHIYYGQLTGSIIAPLRQNGIPIVQTLHEYKLVCPTHGLYSNGHFCDACQGQHYWHTVLRRCNRGSLARSILSMSETYLSEILGSKKAIDQFIAVSNFQKEQLVRLGAPEQKISVVPHFTDVIDNPPTEKGSYFLFVGRIVKDKGIGILLKAYSLLHAESPPLKIVGTGPELSRWKNYSDSIGLTDRVDWLGFKNGDELSKLYQNSLVVINPSMLNETFGLTCLETLAHGRPVIASNIGAFPEVINDEEDGLLVKPGDPHSLKKAMKHLSSRPDLAFEMGLSGWKKVKQKFSKLSHYHRLQHIYSALHATKSFNRY